MQVITPIGTTRLDAVWPVLESHTAATALKWTGMRRGGVPHGGTRRARDRRTSCAGGMVCGMHAEQTKPNQRIKKLVYTLATRI